MDTQLAIKIQYWINQELEIKNPQSIDYFIRSAINKGFTSYQVNELIVQELIRGRYYEPYPGKIAKVPLPFQKRSIS